MTVNKVVAAENEKKLLTLVAAMNALTHEIDPNYGKVAVFLPSADDSEKSVRYFIQKRTFVDTDGIERWKYVARQQEC